MQKLRYGLVVLSMMVCMVSTASAQVSIGIGLPNVSIGINLPLFPELVRVPGYPVYYAPRLDANYFFYDGMYWVYQDDTWYASSWYNGPWGPVDPVFVPLFILRIPVSYYRQPPVYFRGWQSHAPPRWGQHWGHDWEKQRRGWDRWKRSSAPAPAPLPVYQRQYSGDRYPRVEQQHTLRNQSYRYQPRERAVRQHFQQIEKNVSAPQRGRQESPPPVNPRRHESERSMQHQQVVPSAPHAQPPQRGGERLQQTPPERPQPQQRVPAVQEPRQQPRVVQPQHEQPAPRPHMQEQRSQDRGDTQDSNRGRGQGQGRDDDRGRGRDR